MSSLFLFFIYKNHLKKYNYSFRFFHQLLSEKLVLINKLS